MHNKWSIKILADLMGNSVAMIEKHSGHTQVNKAKMRAALSETVPGRGSAPRKKGEKMTARQ